VFPITFQFETIWPYVTSIGFAAVGAAIGAGLYWIITNWLNFK